MVPSRNLMLRHDTKNSSVPYCPQYCIATQLDLEASAAAHRDHRPSRFPRLAMAGDDDEAAGTGTGTSSRGGGGDGKDWLQLSLATASSSTTTTSSSGHNDHSTAPAAAPPAPSMEMQGLSADKHMSARMVGPPLFPMPIRSYPYGGHGRFWPPPASGSMAAPFLPFAPPLRSAGDLMIRVINPPPRTEAAGLWLTLEASPNQAREPILPQIPKSYLRIKDSNITVEVVMKYLADKLGLAQSHQVELTCRGQLLPPFFLVKYVRDSIWCSSAPPAARQDHGEALVLELPAARRSPATSTNHVMTLFYSTSRNRTDIN